MARHHRKVPVCLHAFRDLVLTGAQAVSANVTAVATGLSRRRLNRIRGVDGLLAGLLQGLYDGVLPQMDDVGYIVCLQEIVENGICSQVYHLASSRCLLNQMPESFVSKLRSRYEQVLAQNLYIRRHESIILEKLESEQIEVISLKGTQFSERFFGHVGARGSQDIDILIHPEDFNRVCGLLRQLGYSEPEPYNPRHYHCMVRKQTANGEVVVEIHWSIVKQYTSKYDVERAWQTSALLGHYGYVRTLSVPYTFYAMCLHGANHEMATLKPFLDIVQILSSHGDEISYESLIELSRQDKTFRRVQMVLSRVYDLFPKLHSRKALGELYSFMAGRQLFGIQQYDSIFYSLRVVKDWAWPKIDVARWFADAADDTPAFNLYFRMYARRVSKALKLVSPGSKDAR